MAALWEQLSDDIQRKFRLFHEQEELIHNLEAQLDNVRRQHAQLDVELTPYRDCIVPNEQNRDRNIGQLVQDARAASIYRCSEDVLLEIFQYYLTEYHPNIRNLLLVCRNWNHIAMHNPLLWTRIQTPNLLLDYRSIPNFDKVTTPYVKACIERSQILPLDIELNLGGLPDFNHYARYYLEESLADIVDKIDYKSICSDFEDALEYMTWPDASWKFNYRFINLLNTSVERWRKFKIMVPDLGSDRCVAVFRQIDLPKAKLSSLELGSIVGLGSPIEELSRYLPSVRGIQHLKSNTISLALFPDSPSLLQTLTTIPERIEDILDISRCTGLQSLVLDLQYNLAAPNQGQYHLRIPQLRSLTVKRHIKMLSSFTFHCPVLEQLEMETQDILPDIDYSHPFWWLKPPRVLARQVHWSMASWNEFKFTPGVKAILSLWEKTELVTISAAGLYYTVNVKLDLLNKDVSLKYEDLPQRLIALPETNPQEIRAVIGKWAEDNSFSFHHDISSTWNSLQIM
jgi:hypothetical protein